MSYPTHTTRALPLHPKNYCYHYDLGVVLSGNPRRTLGTTRLILSAFVLENVFIKYLLASVVFANNHHSHPYLLFIGMIDYAVLDRHQR